MNIFYVIKIILEIMTKKNSELFEQELYNYYTNSKELKSIITYRDLYNIYNKLITFVYYDVPYGDIVILYNNNVDIKLKNNKYLVRVDYLKIKDLLEENEMHNYLFIKIILECFGDCDYEIINEENIDMKKFYKDINIDNFILIIKEFCKFVNKYCLENIKLNFNLKS